MKVLVDADACPKVALQITLQLGAHYQVPVWTVASFNHLIESDHHIMVGNAPQEADMKIVNLTKPRDVIVTQDWGLAALVLAKGAYCIHPAGWIFRADKIDFMLEEREMRARLRRGGGRTKGPKKRTEENDQNYREHLERILKLENGGTA